MLPPYLANRQQVLSRLNSLTLTVSILAGKIIGTRLAMIVIRTLYFFPVLFETSDLHGIGGTLREY
jgi:hypothetical protein